MFKIIAGLVVETRLTAISSGYFSSFSFAAQNESTECATRNVKCRIIFSTINYVNHPSFFLKTFESFVFDIPPNTLEYIVIIYFLSTGTKP